ncbi:TetR/AcrR family transcriptional regulator [Herbiconiux moechotypicola]|uniref:TetR/AcrR family transcriptional regulator n=1 Tax=Herbiconiux moechotypicola TaxID=637393 RepID=A0ABP5QBE4_9MICO|nr:TetR/AcrR family transcriptional regulator [Herbiconiux moechotypicola]MCS5729592.1 TetR/AcrR family transcriptional regulator [Herbiconiux moechotypicola]
MSSDVGPTLSEARERLLRVASELFYREGITRVGVDRVVREAGVTRATLYRYFAGKEQLVAAYLEREDASLRASFPAPDTTDPWAAVDAVLRGIADDVRRHHTRGCPFINAAAEYPDARSAVRRIVTAHRAWFAGALRERLTEAGLPAPAALRTAASLVLLRDGTLVGGYLDSPEAALDAFLATARDLLDTARASAPAPAP